VDKATKHDKQLTELVNVWNKLSAWNKIIVFCYALRADAKQKLKSIYTKCLGIDEQKTHR
jgi:hypothetical protein